jgi:hypothetical protein
LLNINRDQDIHGVYHDPPETEKLQHVFLDDEPIDKELSFAKTPGMNHMEIRDETDDGGNDLELG